MAATNDYSSWILLQGVFLITYLCSLCKTAHHYYLELKMTPSNVFFTQATVSTDMGLLKKLEQLLMSIKTKCIQLLERFRMCYQCRWNIPCCWFCYGKHRGDTNVWTWYGKATGSVESCIWICSYRDELTAWPVDLMPANILCVECKNHMLK